MVLVWYGSTLIVLSDLTVVRVVFEVESTWLWNGFDVEGRYEFELTS